MNLRRESQDVVDFQSRERNDVMKNIVNNISELVLIPTAIWAVMAI